MSYSSRHGRTSSSWGYPSDKIMYHGLMNQGSTCYLNSVLQVLFMTKEFRQKLRVPSKHRDDDPNLIDRELMELFGDLEKYTTYTYKITRKLDIRNVYEQQDAAEYFERILRLTSEEASKVFQGELINRNTCSKCETVTDISAAFWYLPLALVDSYGDYSVIKGIKDFFRPSELRGENQMYCERCCDKSDATIKCVVEKHPEVLVLKLKRFDFDMRHMSNVKINCAVDVPFTLQIPQDQTYELFAFVDHFGDLKSGHYTTTVRSQDDDKWYMFDDSIVSQHKYQWFQLDTKEKLPKAYLLFYRKQKVGPADTSSQVMGEVSTPGVPQGDVSVKMDGLETEDPQNRDVDVNAAASVSPKDVSGLKRPAAAPERPYKHEEGDKPPHQQDGDEDKDRGHVRIKEHKEDDDEKCMTSPDDQMRTKAAEGVKNDGTGGRSDLQNIPHTSNFMPYASENQTRWGKQGEVRDRTWIEVKEKGRGEAEQQKNEEFHRVTDQNRQKLETSTAQVERFSPQVELNQEATTGKREGSLDVSDNISRYYHEQKVRATDVNRDYSEGGDKKRPERLENVRDDRKVNKERRRQEHERKPEYDLRKAAEETTGRDDSGTGRTEMCTGGVKETGKLWKKSDLHDQNSMSNERKSPKQGISDSNRRYDDQREDRGM
ncbi:uncharacterized protein LOC115438622 isoform X1 [Sphaeramia orbicularis]|uniref:uncharacterized protein LOC115438622 isoform X1 n=2 Tax=Sphaeramia orbicularis TaxID=375764 RepID=UPI00117DB3AD|nr:uncharacterized protein LOC115438622 isoform X1 [Sphaeramia orbicularis]